MRENVCLSVYVLCMCSGEGRVYCIIIAVADVVLWACMAVQYGWMESVYALFTVEQKVFLAAERDRRAIGRSRAWPGCEYHASRVHGAAWCATPCGRYPRCYPYPAGRCVKRDRGERRGGHERGKKTGQRPMEKHHRRVSSDLVSFLGVMGNPKGQPARASGTATANAGRWGDGMMGDAGRDNATRQTQENSAGHRGDHCRTIGGTLKKP